MRINDAAALLCCVTTVVLVELVAVTRCGGHRDEYLLNGFALRWPSPAEREKSLRTGGFVPRNVVQTKMQMWRDRAYVVQSRYKTGVPFTLGVIELDRRGGGGDDDDSAATEPTVSAYPDYESHRPGAQSNAWKRVNNVIDVYLDAKGRLWALDNGESDEDGAVVKNAGNAKVFAIDVRTDEVKKLKINLRRPKRISSRRGGVANLKKKKRILKERTIRTARSTNFSFTFSPFP